MYSELTNSSVLGLEFDNNNMKTEWYLQYGCTPQSGNMYTNSPLDRCTLQEEFIWGPLMKSIGVSGFAVHYP